MATPPRSDDPVGLRTRRRGYDLALAGCLVAAAALSVATGLPVLVLAVAFVASVAAEELLGRSVRNAFLEAARAESTAPPDSLTDRAADVASRHSVPAPRVVVSEAAERTVSIVTDGGDPAVVLGADVVEGLDASALEGVLAHELAHWRLDHLRGPDLRTPVAHVLGLAVCWAAFLRHLPASVAAVAGACYLLAALDRWSTAGLVVYVLGSLGTVLLPRALVARVRRLEEYRADDLAASVTSPRALCRGLYAIEPGPEDRRAPTGSGSVSADAAGPGTVLAGLTDAYPSTESRLARQGVAPASLG